MDGQEQKFALITGASSGIGYCLAIEFSKRGYKVFGCAPLSQIENMKPLTEEYGVVAFPCDITKIEDVKKAAELIKEQTGGRLHVLYNNAGIATGGPAIEIPEHELERIFQVNVFGHIYMTKYMADYVIAAKGKIIFTSSVAARVPLAWISAYCSTKAAIDQYAMVLRAEMKPFGVAVHSVITGGVRTSIGDSEEANANLATFFNKKSHYYVDGVEETMTSLKNMAHDPKTSILPESYAKQVVRKILSKKDVGFNIYRGGASYTLHLFSRYAPLCLVEWAMAFHFKQLKVWKILRAQQSKKNL